MFFSLPWWKWTGWTACCQDCQNLIRLFFFFCCYQICDFYYNTIICSIHPKLQGPLSTMFPTFLSLCSQADNRKRSKEEENDHLDDQSAADVAWSKHKLLNESIIVALFQGQFKSTVQCLTCHRKSRTFETFMYLSLPLASTSKCSLQVSHQKLLHQNCGETIVVSHKFRYDSKKVIVVKIIYSLTIFCQLALLFFSQGLLLFFFFLTGLSEVVLQGREADWQQ